MAGCCQNLTLGALGSRNVLSVLVGALFKKFGLFILTCFVSTLHHHGTGRHSGHICNISATPYPNFYLKTSKKKRKRTTGWLQTVINSNTTPFLHTPDISRYPADKATQPSNFV